MKKNQIVLIEWLDSKGINNTWEYIEGMESLLPQKCVSVGFLWEDGKEYKTILQSYGGGQVLGRTTIPTRSIIKMRKLSVSVRRPLRNKS